MELENLAWSPLMPYTRGENSRKEAASIAVKQTRKEKRSAGEICGGSGQRETSAESSQERNATCNVVSLKCVMTKQYFSSPKSLSAA